MTRSATVPVVQHQRLPGQRAQHLAVARHRFVAGQHNEGLGHPVAQRRGGGGLSVHGGRVQPELVVGDSTASSGCAGVGHHSVGVARPKPNLALPKVDARLRRHHQAGPRQVVLFENTLEKGCNGSGPSKARLVRQDAATPRGPISTQPIHSFELVWQEGRLRWGPFRLRRHGRQLLRPRWPQLLLLGERFGGGAVCRGALSPPERIHQVAVFLGHRHALALPLPCRRLVAQSVPLHQDLPTRSGRCRSAGRKALRYLPLGANEVARGSAVFPLEVDEFSA